MSLSLVLLSIKRWFVKNYQSIILGLMIGVCKKMSNGEKKSYMIVLFRIQFDGLSSAIHGMIIPIFYDTFFEGRNDEITQCHV